MEGSERTGNSGSQANVSGPTPDHPILQLQQSIGNRAVQRLIQAQFSGSGLASEREQAMQDSSALGFDLDAALSSPWSSLDSETREFMEGGFGYDFSSVRIHANPSAANSSEAIDANAYTVGQDIVFGSGKYSPGSREGRRLIAHELTHVVQQSSSAIAAPGLSEGELAISEPTDQSEQIAESNAAEIMSGGTLGQAAAGESPGAGAVQRDEDEG